MGALQMADASYGDVTLTSPSMVDTMGHILGSYHVDQQIGVQSTLTNYGNTEQKFCYAVQVLESNGSTDYLDYTSAQLLSSQSFSVSQVWIPKVPGTYTVQVFVWDSLATGIPLTDVIEKQIHVVS
jgi:hypothetical protein